MDTIGLQYGERLISQGDLGKSTHDEIGNLIAGLNAWGDAEHNGDGTHMFGRWAPTASSNPSGDYPSIVTAGIIESNHFTRIGPTLLINFEMTGFSVATATSAYIAIWLPGALTVTHKHRTVGQGKDNGTDTAIYLVGLPGERFIRAYKLNLAVWALSAANSNIAGQWFGQVTG